MKVNYKKRIQSSFIFFLLISYLIIQFSGLNFLQDQSMNSYCESLITVENQETKNSNEIYFDFFNDNITYRTLDIFPEIENIKCLSFESYSNSERVILTSNNFYNLILILTFLVSIFLFSLLSLEILKEAPLYLNEPVVCRFSSLKKILEFNFLLI